MRAGVGFLPQTGAVIEARHELPADVVDRLRAICLALPETGEEPAWVGIRWWVRRKAFAHLLVIDHEWPPAYARAVPVEGPTPVLTFRSSGAELAALTATGPPFHKPPWHPEHVTLVLGRNTDWDEVAELVTESWRLQAPKRIAGRA